MQPIIDYLQEMKERGDEKAKQLLYKMEYPDANFYIVVASFVKNKNKPPTVHHGYCKKIIYVTYNKINNWLIFEKNENI